MSILSINLWERVVYITPRKCFSDHLCVLDELWAQMRDNSFLRSEFIFWILLEVSIRWFLIAGVSRWCTKRRFPPVLNAAVSNPPVCIAWSLKHHQSQALLTLWQSIGLLVSRGSVCASALAIARWPRPISSSQERHGLQGEPSA